MSRTQTLALAVASMLVTLIAMLSPRAVAESEPPPARGFDHHLHQGKVAVAALSELACADCHRLTSAGFVRGRPDHQACFGQCHGPSPTRRKPGIDTRKHICESCHAPAAVKAVASGRRRRIRAAPTPATSIDFGIQMSHAAHLPVSGERGCLTCHDNPARGGARAQRAHGRCVGCHAGATSKRNAPPITDCKTCHLPALGAAFGPRLTPSGPLNVTFSHRAHAPHVKGKRQRCQICHAGVGRTTGDELSYPSKRACFGCHDGKDAFSVLAPTCGRCHTAPEQAAPARPAAPARYSHKAHRARGMKLPCQQCHTLDARGIPQSAAAGHAPCSDSGCHRSDFSSRAPTICGVCHVSAEPWRPLHADRRFPPITEFGARFSHAGHLDGDSPGTCTQCHKADGASQRLATGHLACDGKGCHTGGATPKMTACEGCHVPGLLAEHHQRRIAHPWSVRARFDHTPHRVDEKAGEPVACSTCHAGVEEAKNLASIPGPRKADCAPCHDGATAFKLTGHACARCHAP